jgi:hypothetical protein
MSIEPSATEEAPLADPPRWVVMIALLLLAALGIAALWVSGFAPYDLRG